MFHVCIGTSLTSRAGELQVMFIDNCTSARPVVKWGYDAANLDFSSQGSTDGWVGLATSSLLRNTIPRFYFFFVFMFIL